MPRLTVEERFWAKVQKSNGCWLWTGCITRRYGQFAVTSHERRKAHRYSYELAHGPIPSTALVCHHCDTPLCVRPDHLFLGTAQENMADCWAKGRHPAQSKTHCKHGHALTPENTAYARNDRVGRPHRECRLCRRRDGRVHRATRKVA